MLKHRGGMAIAVLLTLTGGLAAPAAEAPGRSWLADQGWRVVTEGGARATEASVLVINGGDQPLPYQVAFLLEASDSAHIGGGPAEWPGRPGTWELVRRVMGPGGTVAPGVAASVHAVFDYALMRPGRAHRVRAVLTDSDTGATLDEVTVRSTGDVYGGSVWQQQGVGTVAVAAAFVAAGSEALEDEVGPRNARGTGSMVGTHTAQRVGGEWVESGSGTIVLRTQPAGVMVIYYTYQAHGPDAADLVATATTDPARASSWRRANGTVEPVTITSASAHITAAGSRQQVGQVVTRSACAATGSFDGSVGGTPWHGTLTMTDGTQTLDLAADTGSHHFSVSFSASR